MIVRLGFEEDAASVGMIVRLEEPAVTRLGV
jgi:hypothetical protein